MVQNSVTYFMDGPLGGQRIRWSESLCSQR